MALQGGMRGVVWADTLQMVILVGGIIAMVTGGLIQVGGFKVMWQKSMSGERLNFNKYVNMRYTHVSFHGDFASVLVYCWSMHRLRHEANIELPFQ